MDSPALRYVKSFNLLPAPAGAVLWYPGQDDAPSTTIRDRSSGGTVTDSGIDSAEALDNSETGVDCSADATSAIPINTVIALDDGTGEQMLVTGTGTTLTVTRGYRGSPAVTHDTGKNIMKLVPPNHGTITGATWKRTNKGLWYLDFDGTDDKIAVGDIGLIKGIEFWLQVDAANQFVIDLDGGTNIIKHDGVLISPNAATHYLDGTSVTVLGSELVTLGDFSASTGWTLGAGTSIGSGVLTMVNVESGVGVSRTPADTLVAGYIYRGQFTIATTTEGSYAINVGTPTGAPNAKLQLSSHSAVGTYADSGVLPNPFNSQNVLLRSASVESSGTLDNFSVKRITPPISDTTTWHHVMITFPTAIDANNVTIGNTGTSWLNGRLALLAVYTDEPSAAFAAYRYQRERSFFGV